MTHDEYVRSVAETRAAPGWSPYGVRGCGDCETMSHCETHHKSEGVYPDDAPKGPCAWGCAVCHNPVLHATQRQGQRDG